MIKYIFLMVVIVSCLSIMNCEDSGDSVIGSKDHDIQSSTAQEPEILANGISTTRIIVNVRRKEDGFIARGMKVHFETSAGSIDQYGITNNNGNAEVILTSVASETDLVAEIKATVIDSTFSSLRKSTESPFSISLSTPDFDSQNNKDKILTKADQQQDNNATIYVKFLGVTFQVEIDETILPADGLSKTKINVKLRETTSQKAIKNAELHAFVNHGLIDGATFTDDRGLGEFFLIADDQPGQDTLLVEYGDKLTKTFTISYLTPKLTLNPTALQVPADGESAIEIVANLLSHNNTPIQGAEIRFSASAGIIPELASTDNNGNAKVHLIAGKQPDSSVAIIARFHTLMDTAFVSFVASSGVVPNSILLNADPNFIWVKETGNIDQTIISATVLGINNRPLGNDIMVKFFILNGPAGGEYIQPSSGSDRESTVIPTVDGIAQATIRSGTKSGTIQIKAQLVDYPDIVSQTTNIVIRSGPPYMWIDPNNANNVIHHVTLAVEPGKHNVCFGNPIQDIGITVYLGDKFNNPVEDGTTVYFTTTGGIITSDAVSCEKGQASVILQNVNPFPYLVSNDPNQLTALNITNPNNDNLKLNIIIPDFEYGKIVNSIGTTNENDGVTVILAYTWGQDQNGNLIKVWTTGLIVYSVGVPSSNFTAVSNKTELLPGEIATIIIRVYDYNGNPVAAGSRLTASTNAGELSDTNLMPSADKYGWGTTTFVTQLLNDLKPGEDEPTTALVKIELDSPNGTGKRSIPINLKITP